jgi:hypothetical protein
VPKLSINIGVLLIILGFFSYIATEMVSLTALIPSLFGIVFVGLGLLAKKSDNMQKHSMHAAMLLALLGLGGSFTGLRQITAALFGGEMPVRFTAASSQAVMAVLCIFFLAFGIKSFIDARKNK